MDYTFEDPDWGNSTEFSYYKFSDSSEFKVSPLLLKTSLDREKKKTKKKQGNEKRKFSEVEIEEANNVKKKKKNKNLQEKTEYAVDNISGEQSDEKKKVKKLGKKNSNLDDSKKLDNTEQHVAQGNNSAKKKKKKKNVSKRNKYKTLNIEQNKKKTVTFVDDSVKKPDFLPEESKEIIPNQNIDIHKIVVNDKEASQDLGKINIMKKSLRINSEKITKVKKDNGKSKMKKDDGKSKIISPDETKIIVNTDSKNEKFNGSSSPKKKGKKPSKSKFKDSKGKTNMNIDNKKNKKNTLVSDNSQEKSGIKTKGIKKKNKTNKDADSCNDHITFNNEESKDNDEVDIKLKGDLDNYLKKLDFDNLENRVSYDSESLSSMQTGLLESDSEDEYIEDEMKEEKEISSKHKVAIEVKPVGNNVDNVKEVMVKKGSNVSLTLVNNIENPSLTQAPVVSKKKKWKLDKNVSDEMLKESEDGKTSMPNAAEAFKEMMTNQLDAARFRLVNEKMYTATSSEAAKIFKSDPSAFVAYHNGFKSQVSRWPVNPLDNIITWLKKKSNTLIVADFGCGEALLAASVPQKNVHSFDLVALNKRVTVCDMSHTPLQSQSVDVAVFCLSLMGTNVKDFLLEANRVLRNGGTLKIAEVESRISSAKVFVNQVMKFGFNCIYSDTNTKYFHAFDFKKCANVNKNVPNIILKPCVYKKR